MKRQIPQEMKLAELAERSGIPARTIRLYIARGLLEGPLRAGRGAAYGPLHLETLDTIRRLQSEGWTLQQIHHRLGGAPGKEGLPTPTSWLSYSLAPDVVVWVQGESRPWRRKQIENALKAMHELLSVDETEPQEEDR